jgi:hypothetical protein
LELCSSRLRSHALMVVGIEIGKLKIEKLDWNFRHDDEAIVLLYI